MVEQNTKEWEDLRKTKIGASDAPIIMGDSPWKTPNQLWKEKSGLVENTYKSAAMQKGHDSEQHGRDIFKKETGVEVFDKVLIHTDCEWMMASLDGISEDCKTCVEIKTCGKEDFEKALKNEVPKKYVAQLQHQLCVTGLDKMYYLALSYSDITEYVLFEVQRDQKYIEKMLLKEAQFFSCMQNFSEPALTDRDYVVRDDSQFINICSLLSNLKKEMDLIKEKEKEYREILISMSEGKNCICNDVKIQQVISSGRIDYSSIPEIQDIDLERYRKSPSKSWRITIK